MRATPADLARRIEALARQVATRAPPAEIAGKVEEIRAGLFAEQITFLDDPHKAKAALCTRRAGKTYVIAAAHLINALEGRNGCYITVTGILAKRLMWNGRAGLKALNRRFGLKFEFNNTEKIATAPNGATIMLGGAETRDECEKYRGEPFGLVTIDEPASIKEHLEYLMDEVLEPTLLDEDGTLALIGTPGRVLAGKFFEITSGQPKPIAGNDEDDEEAKLADWSVHRWSLHQNPHLVNRDRFLTRVFRRHGWNPGDPPARALREYGGKWVREDSTLVYNFEPARNTYTALPTGIQWQYVAGLDLGDDPDPSALRVWAYHPKHPTLYGVAAWKEKRLTPHDIAERFLGSRHMPDYDPKAKRPQITGLFETFGRMVVVADTGGLGKMVVRELNNRYGLGVIAAQKADKLDHIELFNDDLRRGLILVTPDDPVIAEWNTLQWAEDLGTGKRQEDPRLPNDLSDAGLYPWRWALHHLHRPAPEGPPPPGSEAALAAQEKAIEDRLDRQEPSWWEQEIPSLG